MEIWGSDGLDGALVEESIDGEKMVVVAVGSAGLGSVSTMGWQGRSMCSLATGVIGVV